MQKTMLAVAVLALAFTACGGGGAGSTPEATFEAMKSAAVSEDWGALYDLASPDAQKQAVGPIEMMRKQLSSLPDVAKEKMAEGMGLSVDELETLDARDMFIKMMEKHAGSNPKLFGEAADQTVKETKIDGDKAKVVVEGGGKTDTISMIKIDGKWYMSSFGR